MAERYRRRDDEGRDGGFRGPRREGGPRRDGGQRGDGGFRRDGVPRREGGPGDGPRAGGRPPGGGQGFGARPRRWEGQSRPPSGPRREWSDRPPRDAAGWREAGAREGSGEGRGEERPRRPSEGGWQDRPPRGGPPPYGRGRPPFRGPGRFEGRPPAAPPSPELLQEAEELVAGRRPVEEAFAARREARRLLVVPERRAALDALVLHATTLRIPVVEVEGGTLTQLSGFDGHQGVAVALAARPQVGLDDVLARARERDEAPFVLLLDSLEDPQNLGTLLRSAEACGVHGVIFPTRRSAPLSPSAIKASAGATEHLLLVAVDDLAGTLADLRSRGLRLIGADEGAPLRYGEADLRGPLALVVGSEERGISGALRRRLDMAVRIPMRGRIGSLNAAVAGSVLLFAAAEQRGTAEAGESPERDPGRRGTRAAESQAAGEQAAAGKQAAAEAPAADSGPQVDAEAAPTPAPRRGTAKRRKTVEPSTPTESSPDDGGLLPGETGDH